MKRPFYHVPHREGVAGTLPRRATRARRPGPAVDPARGPPVGACLDAQRGLSADDDLLYLQEFEHVTLARLLLAESAAGRSALDSATGLLQRLLSAAEAGGREGTSLEVLVLLALAQSAAWRRASALAAPAAGRRPRRGRRLRTAVHRRRAAGSPDCWVGWPSDQGSSPYLRRLAAASAGVRPGR